MAGQGVILEFPYVYALQFLWFSKYTDSESKLDLF